MSECNCDGKAAIIHIAATDTRPEAMLVEIVLNNSVPHTLGDGADMIPLPDDVRALAKKIIDSVRDNNGNN